MTIQFNTDKTIKGDEKNEEYFTSLIEDGLSIYESHITRIELHLKDENGSKDGLKDMTCSMEARLKGMKPIAVTSHADTVEEAVSDAIDKMKTSLKTIIARLSNQ